MPRTSCEPRRRSAYSPDLRWRMVWQTEVLGIRYKDVASHLNVDITTVWRTVKLFRQTGDVQKKAYPRERAYRKLSASLELIWCLNGQESI
jgi:transposase